MSVRVRMAPSPTGFLHVGTARTFLFNWLFARRHEGECLLRIENTDMNREVEGAAEQIQRSLTWLGIDWDALSFQLDRMERCQHEARRLVAEGHAYEDEGAVRFRMPDEGVTAYDDLVLGRVETPNEVLDDLVLVRGDGRPTYNFASPVDDWMDGIYLRALSEQEYADALVEYLGPSWDEAKVRRIAPLVQEKLTRLGEF